MFPSDAEARNAVLYAYRLISGPLHRRGEATPTRPSDDFRSTASYRFVYKGN